MGLKVWRSRPAHFLKAPGGEMRLMLDQAHNSPVHSMTQNMSTRRTRQHRDQVQCSPVPQFGMHEFNTQAPVDFMICVSLHIQGGNTPTVCPGCANDGDRTYLSLILNHQCRGRFLGSVRQPRTSRCSRISSKPTFVAQLACLCHWALVYSFDAPKILSCSPAINAAPTGLTLE